MGFLIFILLIPRIELCSTEIKYCSMYKESKYRHIKKTNVIETKEKQVGHGSLNTSALSPMGPHSLV